MWRASSGGFYKNCFNCGVPQGSILAPLFFHYFHHLNFYAHESQLYRPLKSRASLQPLLDCLDEIKNWMANDLLQLTNDKTEVIILAQLKTVNAQSRFLALLFHLLNHM